MSAYRMPQSTKDFYQLSDLFNNNLEDLAIAIVIVNREINKARKSISFVNLRKKKPYLLELIKKGIDNIDILNRKPNMIYSYIEERKYELLYEELKLILDMKYKDFLELKKEVQESKQKFLKIMFRYKEYTNAMNYIGEDIKEDN